MSNILIKMVGNNIEIKRGKEETLKTKPNNTGFYVLIISLILLSIIFLIIQNQLLNSIYVDKSFGEDAKVE